MTIPDREEFKRFYDQLYVMEGRDLNVLWRAAVILASGEITSMDEGERRNLGQIMQAALRTGEL